MNTCSALNANCAKRNDTTAMTTTDTPPAPARKVPAFAIVMVIGVVFLGGLLALMLIKPPQKALCDEAAPESYALALPRIHRPMDE